MNRKKYNAPSCFTLSMDVVMPLAGTTRFTVDPEEDVDASIRSIHLGRWSSVEADEEED